MENTITQDEFFDKGLDIIQRVRENRKETIKNEDLLSNALFRLSQSPDSEMWLKEKELRDKTIKGLQEELSVLETELHYLKPEMDEDYFKILLTQYGTVLAETTNIYHVKQSMYDEFELSKALSQTSEAIKIKNHELEKALEDGNEDLATILNAEIRFFRADMKNHHWGIDRLETIDNEIVSKHKRGM